MPLPSELCKGEINTEQAWESHYRNPDMLCAWIKLKKPELSVKPLQEAVLTVKCRELSEHAQ